MCGIAGLISADRSIDATVIRAMTAAMAHRGPDAEGFFETDLEAAGSRLYFGHRRLAIIDLDPRSDQPFRSLDDKLAITFNGEIYNFVELRGELSALGHAFRTSSDTEVLLAAYRQWGPAMLPRLSGMFAFAIFDRGNDTVFLARDPFGEKPLYYSTTPAGLVFASEIPSLLCHPGMDRGINWSAINQYLISRYVFGPDTMFRAIRKLPAGCSMTWKAGAISIERYYTPPDATDIVVKQSFDTAKAELGAALDHSVRIRMRSDAPFGAFLSGGLDSSSLVALMSRHSQGPVRTYSVGYEEADYSELKYARAVADVFATRHTELVVNAGDLAANLHGLVRLRGAPLSETADIPIYLMAKKAAQDVKMVLTGEGSDELMAGYPKHRAEAIGAAYRMLVPSGVHRSLVQPMLSVIGGSRLNTLARSVGERDFAARMPLWFGAMSADDRRRLAPQLGGAAGAAAFDPFPLSASPAQSALRRVLFFDQTSWLPDNLLERADSSMMAASIEGRMPFLDTDLARVISRMPDKFRLGTRGKYVLREIMKDVLPDEILTRRKVGFKLPVAIWLRTTLKDFVVEHLSGASSVIRQYLDGATIDAILDAHFSGREDNEKLIWMLLGLEIFHRELSPAL